jgi:hypothetical protein
MDIYGFSVATRFDPPSSTAWTAIHRITQAISFKCLCMISDPKLLMMLHYIPEFVILLASFCLVPCGPTLEFGGNQASLVPVGSR